MLDTFGNMLSKPALLPKSIKPGSRLIRRGWVMIDKGEKDNTPKYYNLEFGVYVAAEEIDERLLYVIGIYSPETKLIYSNIFCLP